MNYIGKRKIHWCHRGFWVVCFSLSLIGCTLLARQTYLRWSNNPIIVIFDQKLSHVSEVTFLTHWKSKLLFDSPQIPFPAVTFCFNEKFSNQGFNINEILDRYAKNQTKSKVEEAQVHALHEICPQVKKTIDLRDPNYNLSSFDYFYSSVMIMPFSTGTFEFNEVVFKNLRSVFHTTFAFNHGPCRTFNMVKRSDLFRDNIARAFRDSATDANSSGTPKRSSSAGSKYGFKLDINISKESYPKYCTATDSYFVLSLHSPFEFPDASSSYFILRLERSSADV
jgi:acid-sensing ion channel, other